MQTLPLYTDTDTEIAERASLRIATDISRGFDAGNFANAYQSHDLEHCLERLSINCSAEYIAAFTIGFFSSYSESEIGSDFDAYLEAFGLVGARCIAAGYIDDPATTESETE